MSVFTNIHAALNTKLSTLAGSPRIVWPNTMSTPASGNEYMTPHLMPATTILHNLDGTQKHSGIYQIDVYMPVQKGLATLTGWLDALYLLFKSTSLTAGGDVVHIQAVGIGATERQDAWYRGYVEINYICYS